jgi:hypothetical protein
MAESAYSAAQDNIGNKKALSEEQVDRILKVTKEVVAISAAIISAAAGVKGLRAAKTPRVRQ